MTVSPLHKTATLLNTTALGSGYHLLRLQLLLPVDEIHAGQQIRINDELLPVMRSYPTQQRLELLCKRLPPWASPQTILDIQIKGEKFQLPTTSSTALLVAEDLGLAPITFLAERLRKEQHYSSLVLLGFTGELPFRPAPSRIMVSDLPAGVIATMPLFEDWHLPSRIAHADEPPGCFGGTVLELARSWLQQQHETSVKLYISGDSEMISSGVNLANEFGLEYSAVVVGDN